MSIILQPNNNLFIDVLIKIADDCDMEHGIEYLN